MHTAYSLQNKSITSYFPTTKEISRNIYISMHFGFNNKFVRTTRTRPIFQKFQKIIVFSFSIWGYNLIRKMYFDY
jgi:hypothetical protein